MIWGGTLCDAPLFFHSVLLALARPEGRIGI